MSNRFHFFPADILLPRTSPEKWSVIACDQYTSEPEYWASVEKTVGDAPSALRLILPEAYLGRDDAGLINSINKNMTQYLDGGVFKKYENTLIYTERTQRDGRIRRGIVGLIDLEDYDYRPNSSAAVRATEQTVLERIPPRVKIRKGAILELPHVMLLFDDPENTVIEPLNAGKQRLSRAYGFDLMENSGHLDGYSLTDADVINVQTALERLYDKSGGLLFAVGDGNHSLASAKECYLQDREHTSRYALVEIVNLHDSSLEFEPIYRVVFGAEPEGLIEAFVNARGGEYSGADAQVFTCVYGKNSRVISVRPSQKLCVGTLQSFLDGYLPKHSGASEDYIHGEEAVRSLCKKPDTTGFLFGGMQKDELFSAVAQDGSLPRKTFSMGHAWDKRFYLEAQQIK